MELEQINIVRLHHLQAVFNVFQYTCFILCMGFGGNHNVIADVGQRKPDFLFTVGIGIRCVKVADTALICRLQELNGVFHTAPLQRQAAHSRLGNREPGIPELKRFEFCLLFCIAHLIFSLISLLLFFVSSLSVYRTIKKTAR